MPDDPLFDIAAALADGAPVDWAAAERQVADETDRALLSELQFIAGVTSVHVADRWGPLEILEHVGRGTFGDVYRAWDSRLDREVALKVLRRRERDDEAQASTAVQEGRLLARIRHPNVVTVYGAERVDDRVGVWMEFVHGKTLEEELRERGPFDVARVIKIGIELGSALSTVHRAGVIHRDVKAQNVMRDQDGRLVLTDFGAGIELEDSPDGAARELAGTPVCVAPEVLAGQAATPQSDIYSLGVLLYHLLTGTYPVRGRSLKEVQQAHANGTRVPLQEARPDVPHDVARIIDRALDPDPRQRYDSPDTLGAAIAAIASPERDKKSKRPALRGSYAAVVVLLLAAVGIGSWAAWPAAETPASPVRGDTPPSSQEITVIEFPRATRTDPVAINDGGAIAGSYIDDSGATRGFLWSEGKFTRINVPDAVRTRPTGMNNEGTIVGDFDYAHGNAHGFLLRGNVTTVIDVPGSTLTRANGINGVGDVVGDFRDARGATHGFFLRGGVFSNLDVPGAKSTRAFDLNDQGDVVGDYQDPAGKLRGFLFANNRFTTIDAPGAFVTQVFGINAHGTIVGRFEEDARSRSLRGFSLKNGAFTPIDVFGSPRTQAHAINTFGAIVGSYLGGDPMRYRGFLLNP